MSFILFFIKQKTAYEMRISDWSSDVCSSDLDDVRLAVTQHLYLDQAFVRALFFDSLDSIDHQFHQWGVDIGAGTDILDQPLDVDITHAAVQIGRAHV